MGEPNDCGCDACEPPRDWRQYGELCLAKCSAPGRYVDGYCVFFSMCVDVGADEARPPKGNEAQFKGYIPTDRELAAFSEGLRLGRLEAKGGRHG